MSSRRALRRTRFRIGCVSVYLHHGSWWIYHRDGNRQVRRKVSAQRDHAEQVAAQINAQLATGAPSFLSFEPIGVPELRQQFLDRHEHVLNSSLATVNRYRAATQHLVNFASRQARPLRAHEIKADAFAAYLRLLEVAPNHHVPRFSRLERSGRIEADFDIRYEGWDRDVSAA